MNEQKYFHIKAAEKAHDRNHLLKIRKAITTYDDKVVQMKSAQFVNWQDARHTAAQIKTYVLENLPELLEQFEKAITVNGAEVLWAETAEEAQQLFLSIVKKHAAQKIVKSKSMTTEEISLNEICEANGLEVLESDLGELIVQLAGEKPYHIVTPAMHKSKAEISQLFQDKLGSAPSDSAEELTMVARKHLRQAYATADIGVTGANFLVANPGAVVVTENEGNIRLTTACPPVHVVIAGIEKIIPRLQDLSLFLPLLATSGTGQQITGYNNIIRGPRREGEIDGPQKMYIIMLDNSRSRMYQDQEMNIALRCIRCGACLNTCPVYKTVGGHTYHTTYQGPIGSVITPQLQGLKTWHHLSDASSLCASCSDVCPVEIPLHELLLENRWRADQSNSASRFWRTALRLWATTFGSRRSLQRRRIFVPGVARWLLPHSLAKRIPHFPKKSFAQWWKKHEQP